MKAADCGSCIARNGAVTTKATSSVRTVPKAAPALPWTRWESGQKELLLAEFSVQLISPLRSLSLKYETLAPG